MFSFRIAISSLKCWEVLCKSSCSARTISSSRLIPLMSKAPEKKDNILHTKSIKRQWTPVLRMIHLVHIGVNLNLKWRKWATSSWGITSLPTYHLVELQSPEALQQWPSVVPLTAPGPFAASDIPSPGRPADTASHHIYKVRQRS